MTEIRISVDLPPLAPGRIPAPELSPDWKARGELNRQCCPMDTYDTDSAGDLRAVCTCLEDCGCLCRDCTCPQMDDECE